VPVLLPTTVFLKMVRKTRLLFGVMVGGSVQSLGQSTTKSVVQALFSIIVIDALFAVFYLELGI